VEQDDTLEQKLLRLPCEHVVVSGIDVYPAKKRNTLRLSRSAGCRYAFSIRFTMDI
jgi:hypothetical protein